MPFTDSFAEIATSSTDTFAGFRPGIPTPLRNSRKKTCVRQHSSLLLVVVFFVFFI